MTEDKEIRTQINEYHKLIGDLKKVNIIFPDEYVAWLLIEKLPQSWNYYKQHLKHKNKQLSLYKLISHTIIEDTSQKEIVGERANVLAARAIMIQNKFINKRYTNTKKKLIVAFT